MRRYAGNIGERLGQSIGPVKRAERARRVRRVGPCCVRRRHARRVRRAPFTSVQRKSVRAGHVFLSANALPAPRKEAFFSLEAVVTRRAVQCTSATEPLPPPLDCQAYGIDLFVVPCHRRRTSTTPPTAAADSGVFRNETNRRSCRRGSTERIGAINPQICKLTLCRREIGITVENGTNFESFGRLYVIS